MSKGFVLCMAGLILMAPFAAAQDEALMGLYEGKFTSGAWKDTALKVQMVARGNGKFEAVFPFESPAARVSLHGRKEKKEAKDANFTGTVDPGAAMGGKYEVTARLAAGVFAGEFSGAGSKFAFETKRVVRMSPTYDRKPPEGAVVLLDGSNLDAWERWPLKWHMTEEGAMEVCNSSLVTKEEFGDAEIHLEFRTPFMATSSGQGRGNSGVYVQGRYEIQVLDSFGLKPAYNLCGGIYKVAVPAADVCAPPLQWQTYDITFTAPRFDAVGKKTKNARMTVVHNGVTIHDDLDLGDVTPGGVSGQEAATGPIMLQDHGNSVRFRNTWVVKK
jgi:3-keto-disaccharide hydrolase